MNPDQLSIDDMLPFSQAIQKSADQEKFAGADYVPSRDDRRLTGQIERVYNLMSDGKWRTLRQIAEGTGDPEASVSAQLRHLRKAKWGAHTIERRHIEFGLFEYRLDSAS
jgi:hypothetical protein